MKQNGFLIVFVSIIYLIDSGQSDNSLPPEVKKCNPGDGNCLAAIFNYLIEYYNGKPDYGIPNLNPYRPYQTWSLTTRSKSFLTLISFTGFGSNIGVFKLDQTRVLYVSGFGPGTSNTEIEAYLLIPRFVIECYFDCYARAALVVPFHAKGDVTAVVTNDQIHVRIKYQVIVRNGMEYLQIICIESTLQLGGFHVDFRFRSIIPLEKEVVNGISNSNWRQYVDDLRPDLQNFTSIIVGAAIKPIFERVPIKDFFLC